MPSSNVSWGIEVGAGALKAVKLGRNGDDVELLDFVVIPHKRVLSAPEIDQTEANRLAISALSQQHELSGASIAISVPGHSAFARFAKLPPVDPKRIKDIVKFEAVQQIPFPLTEVEWDYQTFASPDSPDVEVGIFAMTRERVMERLTMWAEAEVTPDIVTLSPVAAYNAIAYDMAFSERTPGTVILDVGTTSTDLIVAEAGRVWIRTFPIGGHQFTEALVSAFKLSYLKAEKLKREAESSKHARHVFQAMRPVFSDLAQDVQRSIGYYQSLQRDANLTRLIGIGSTFQLPGLRKYLSQQLQMEVLRLEEFNRLKPSGPRADEFKQATMTMTTAYGLALQGLGLQTISANLMPTAVMREAMWRRKVGWFGLAAGLAVAAGGVSFFKPLVDRAKVSGQPKPQVIEQVKNELTSLRAEWQKVEDFKDFRAANAAMLLQNREIFAHLMNDFGEMMADAQAKATKLGAQPGTSQANGFLFRRLDTRYTPPTGGAGADGSDQPAPRRAGRRGAQPTAPDPSLPAGGDPGAKVVVMLEVSTTVNQPERFVQDTLQNWLYENENRPDAPYTLKFLRWERLGSERIAADAGAGAGNDGDLIAGGPMPAGGDDPWAAPPDRGEGQFQRGGSPFGGGGEVVGGGGSSPGLGSGSLGQSNLGQLAPLPPAPPLAEPGATITTFRVTFEAVLRTGKPEGQA